MLWRAANGGCSCGLFHGNWFYLANEQHFGKVIFTLQNACICNISIYHTGASFLHFLFGNSIRLFYTLYEYIQFVVQFMVVTFLFLSKSLKKEFLLKIARIMRRFFLLQILVFMFSTFFHILTAEKSRKGWKGYIVVVVVGEKSFLYFFDITDVEVKRKCAKIKLAYIISFCLIKLFFGSP